MSGFTETFLELAADPAPVAAKAGMVGVQSGGTILLGLEVQSWPAVGIDSPADLILEFEAVRDYKIQPDPGEDRTVRAVTDGPLVWDYRSRCSIMGNAPLPDPPRFFVEFSGLLHDLGVDRPASCYLNWRGSFAGWREVAYSRASLLLSAPHEIAAPAAELLDHQAADYMLLNDPLPEGGDRVFAAAFGRSWIIAESVRRLK